MTGSAQFSRSSLVDRTLGSREGGLEFNTRNLYSSRVLNNLRNEGTASTLQTKKLIRHGNFFASTRDFLKIVACKIKNSFKTRGLSVSVSQHEKVHNWLKIALFCISMYSRTSMCDHLS